MGGIPVDRREYTGVFHATQHGYGFVTPDEGGEDWFIPARRTGGAWDGDRVVFVPCREDQEGERTAGKVVQVTQRGRSAVTGVLERREKKLWLIPGDPKLPGPILIRGGAHTAAPGDRAAAAIVSYGYGMGQTPSADLVESFGAAHTLTSAVRAILYDHRIPENFPQGVLDQAMETPDTVPPQALEGRLDLRDALVFTIDGDTARDFDDAVSLERDGAGRRVLGVHIADVSWYVRPGSPLDGEALARGTSVYFADRVVPMLPIPLSNGICSLNPGVDRLALSCFMTLDEKGEVVDSTLARTVIRSARRLTYRGCNALLEGEKGAEEELLREAPVLREMEDLARQLRRRRRQRGSLFLESSEVAITCDENGEPVACALRGPGRSEGIIEEFMLLANETVAAALTRAGRPCVYRVHHKPDPDKLEALRTALNPLGYNLGAGDGFALQRVLDRAQGQPEGPMINTLVLRSQSKAMYSTQNDGHFGLASRCYCHFTSPIRRYPDLLVHRQVHALLDREKGTARDALEEGARQSTARELEAAAAQREIEKCYLARMMEGHVGEVFPAAVSGVTRFGLFLMLSNGVEGLLPVECLPPDEYHLREETMTLEGREAAHRYTLGTQLEVQVAAAVGAQGRVDFCLPGQRAEDLPYARPRLEAPSPLPRGRRKPKGRPAPRRRRGRR